MVPTDRKSQVMIFEIKGELIALVGDPLLIHSQISLKAMKQTLKKQECGFWVECNSVEKMIETPREEGKNGTEGQLDLCHLYCRSTTKCWKYLRGCLHEEPQTCYHHERGQ